mgnify:FL=1|tara:strand:- start:974 stop:1222 length:249 start_codon:yes stop_codon:yes gene_type:complete
MNQWDKSGSGAIVKYTDRREILMEAIDALRIKAESGEVQAIAMVTLMTNGDVHCQESYKSNSDRLALIGATQILSQHIMNVD